jgi:glutamate/tyrosine decarboxylase-like PLP-dependent enzyme
MGADRLTSLTDQQGYAWLGSPLAVELELVSLAWLKELFGLPEHWGGITTTGASMAKFVGLAAARQWWGERHGVDVGEHGVFGLPRMPVLSGGYIHASAVKMLSMLGVGRRGITRHERDGRGRMALAGLERSLRALDGEPAVIVATAGEVNAGDFDPIADLADLAEE